MTFPVAIGRRSYRKYLSGSRLGEQGLLMPRAPLGLPGASGADSLRSNGYGPDSEV